MADENMVFAAIAAARERNNICLERGVEEAVIRRAEEVVSIGFPAQLIRWLTLCNGGTSTFGSVLGATRSVLVTQESIPDVLLARPHWQRKGWIPVANDGCGSYYVLFELSRASPVWPVGFIDLADETRLEYVVASHIFLFLMGFFQQESSPKHPPEVGGWPFDRQWALANDPALFRVEGTPLPWEVADQV